MRYHPSIKIRNDFAHPKLIEVKNTRDQAPSLSPTRSIAWEVDLHLVKVKSECEKVEVYCLRLLETAAKLLERTYQSGSEVSDQKYPHLGELRRQASLLRSFLHASRTSISGLSLSEPP